MIIRQLLDYTLVFHTAPVNVEDWYEKQQGQVSLEAAAEASITSPLDIFDMGIPQGAHHKVISDGLHSLLKLSSHETSLLQ